MRSLRKRPAVVLLMASLWLGWAIWANAPHYYDAHAMEKGIAAVLGQANVNLQPAEAGFPFAYMRYDYSNSNRLTIHDTTLSALLPNVLFSLGGILGVTLFVIRVRRVSVLGALALGCLITPAAVMYFLLNGLHPDIIVYVYIIPLIWLMMSLAAELIRGRGRQDNEMHASGGGRAFRGGRSTPAAT